MRRLVALVAIAAVATGGAGCGDEEPDERRRTGPPVFIDERAGEFAGVRIGAPRASVERVLGPAYVGEGGLPLEAPEGTVSPGVGYTDWTTLLYDHVAVDVGRRTVRGFTVTHPRARTRRGVAIGDPAERADEAYGGSISCFDSPVGESDVPVRECTGKIGRLYLHFGGDPIGSISVRTRGW